MYIRKASRTYKGKTYSNYLLVESILTPKGPRQKIICSLGDLSPRPRQDWLALAHKLESSLCGQQELAGAAGDAALDGLLAKVRSADRDRKDTAGRRPTHLLGHRARAVEDAPGQHHRLADRGRDGTPHPQGDRARADPPGSLQTTRHRPRNHAPSTELGTRRGGPKIVTKKPTSPYLSMVRSQNRGSWVKRK